jgi:hypothetical protein
MMNYLEVAKEKLSIEPMWTDYGWVKFNPTHKRFEQINSGEEIPQDYIAGLIEEIEEEKLASVSEGENWSGRLGSCTRVRFKDDGYTVALLEAGRGDYASRQRSPDISKKEARRIARRAKSEKKHVVVV